MPSASDGFVCPDQLPDVPEYRLLCEQGCYLFHKEDAIQAAKDKAAIVEHKRISAACGVALESYHKCELALEESALDIAQINAKFETERGNRYKLASVAFVAGIAATVLTWFAFGY